MRSLVVKEFLEELQNNYKNSSHVIQRDVWEIVAHHMGFSYSSLFSEFQTSVSFHQQDQIKQDLLQKSQGKPLSYILGYVDFYDLRLQVNEHVLIPRQETEVWLDILVQKMQKRKDRIIFDVCCGSGCLGLALKKRMPYLQVYLSDLSEEALLVAKANAASCRLDVEWFQGDLLDAFPQDIQPDVVLCNPPYISFQEYINLDVSVKEFEPRLALTSGLTGLEMYKRLAEQLPSRLRPGSLVALEIGSSQKEAVIDLFSAPCWGKPSCYKDYAGHDRSIFLEVE